MVQIDAGPVGTQVAQADGWVLIVNPSLPWCEPIESWWEHGPECAAERGNYFLSALHSCVGGEWKEEVGKPEPVLAIRMRWGRKMGDDSDTDVLLTGGWRSLSDKARFVRADDTEGPDAQA